LVNYYYDDGNVDVDVLETPEKFGQYSENFAVFVKKCENRGNGGENDKQVDYADFGAKIGRNFFFPEASSSQKTK